MKQFTARWGQLVIFLVFVALALIDTSRWTGGMAAWPRIGGIIGILWLSHRYTKRHFKWRIEHSHHPSSLKPVSPDRAGKLQTEVTENALVTFTQADVFARAVVEASEIQKRIIEQYEPGRRTLRQEVTIDIEIPQSTLQRLEASGRDASGAGGQRVECSRFYFPVLLPPKGVIYDDLRVHSADGGELPTLAYREYAKVASGVLHLLLAAACFTRPDELPDGARVCERNAIAGILRRIAPRQRTNGVQAQCAVANGQSEHTAHTDLEAAEPVVGSPNGDADAPQLTVVPDGRSLAKALRELDDVSLADPICAKAIRLAANLVKVLSSHYAIVVEIPATASGRFTLKYECTLIPELDLESGREHVQSDKKDGRFVGRLRSWRAGLETLFGARPVSIKISLDNAWSCQSYHVIVRCSQSLYVSSQELSLPSPDYLKRLAKNAPTAPHIRFRRRLGQSYAHFYARYLSEPRTIKVTDESGVVKLKDGKPVSRKEKAPKLILNFAEVPPGSLCRAALAAIAAAALVWIIGYGIAHLRGASQLSTDVPVLILAFPGVAASWLGFDASTPDLFEGSLMARLSLACTTLVSLLATMLYVEPPGPASRATTVSAHQAPAFKFGVLGITDWRWETLVVLAIFNASYLCYRWSLNAWRFKYLGVRPDPAGLGIKAYEDLDEQEEIVPQSQHGAPAAAPTVTVMPDISANGG